MTVKLLIEYSLEFLSLKGDCTCSSESTLVKCHIVGNHMSRLINTILVSGIMGNYKKLFLSGSGKVERIERPRSQISL